MSAGRLPVMMGIRPTIRATVLMWRVAHVHRKNIRCTVRTLTIADADKVCAGSIPDPYADYDFRTNPLQGRIWWGMSRCMW